MRSAVSYVVPLDPYNVVEPVVVAGDAKFAMDGDAEIPMDHKIQGKYGGVCRVVKSHSKSTLDLQEGDLVIIWDVAIAPFELPRGAGSLYLIKDADIFAKVSQEESESFLSVLGGNEQKTQKTSP